MRKIDKQEP